MSAAVKSAAVKMPETPEELESFVRGARNQETLEPQRETLAELHGIDTRQSRIEGRVEHLGQTIDLYRADFQGLREDFRSLLERFDSFQAEVRRENEKFRQETRTENEKFRQEVSGKFSEMDHRFEKIDHRFEKMDERLLDMQKSITLQTRWLLAVLVAAPAIYGVMEKVLDKLIP
jgi:chromosome segregation ATPase